MAAAIKKYILTGAVSTTDSGAAPAGSYAGAGVGTMSINDTALASDLLNTFLAKYNDDDLATNMANDIDRACSTGDPVSTLSNGTVTFPGGSSAFSGPGQGRLSGNKGTIEGMLKACFSSMKNMSAGGNALYALQLATAVTMYLTAGTINVDLKLPFLSGSGSGRIV